MIIKTIFHRTACAEIELGAGHGTQLTGRYKLGIYREISIGVYHKLVSQYIPHTGKVKIAMVRQTYRSVGICLSKIANYELVIIGKLILDLNIKLPGETVAAIRINQCKRYIVFALLGKGKLTPAQAYAAVQGVFALICR